MKHILIIVDMQKDFVDGALGTSEAVGIVERVAEKIAAYSADPDGSLIATLDTHAPDYMETAEGKHLPVPHCIKGTPGWQLDSRITAALTAAALAGRTCHMLEKPTFGSTSLPALLLELSSGEPFTLEFCGLCTDICVVSNALLCKAHFPEIPITVDAAACAGVTPATHNAALATMQMCQIEINNR